jgi:hypothetical protein
MDEHDDQDDGTDVAEAQPEAPAFPEVPAFPLGPPFAFSDAKLIDRQAGSDGCFASLLCDECEQPFRLNLLTAGYKVCPTPDCGARYTSALVVCHDDNADLFTDVIEQVLTANGVQLPELDDDDRDDDDDDE